jgi:primosomal protein N' (replication factor Y) (superfamily II helicase)
MSHPLIILRLVLPVPLPGVFDYSADLKPNEKLFEVGDRVLVNFSGRYLVGIVLEITDQTAVPLQKLKSIHSRLDSQALLPVSLLSLMHFASVYYHHPLGNVLTSVLPKYFRKSKREHFQVVLKINPLMDVTEVEGLCTKKQKALYDYLVSQDQACDESHLKEMGFNKTHARALVVKNVLIKEEIKIDSLAVLKSLFQIKKEGKREPNLSLNLEQQAVYDNIIKALNHFSVFLLEGITGSGKTEVYLQVIAAVVARGKKALVLVPEIGLTPQMLARFESRFDFPILIFHSHLTDKSRAVAWLQSKEAGPAILIGTRSALFTPCENLGVIIIDEEHDLSFKQQIGFRYSARDLAIIRAKENNIPIILGSATPSLESFYNAKKGRYQAYYLNTRANNAVLPDIRCVDMRQAQVKQGLVIETQDVIAKHLEAGNQVLVFINRRGYAPVILCHHCAWIAICKNCDAKLTYHSANQNLICHHCNEKQPLPEVCPSCCSPQLFPMGSGTQRIEKNLAALFPQYPLVRIDRDSTRRQGELTRLLEEVAQGKHQLLVGTQMLAKGHHFENLSLVVVLNADAGLMGIDYRASERFGQLLWQVAGRAGRGAQKGEVLIQTYYPTHPLLFTLLQQGYQAFAEKLLAERIAAHLPPSTYDALILAESENEKVLFAWLESLKRQLKYDKFLQLHGPIPALMARKVGRYHAYLILQSHDRKILHHALRQGVMWIQSKPLPRKLRVGLDVDPMDLF